MPADDRSEEGADAPGDHGSHGTIPVDPKRTQRETPYAGRPYLLGTLHPATEEIRELAGTLGLEPAVEAYQPRSRPHPGTFFGKGRVQALRAAVDEWRAGIWPDAWSWDGERWVMTGGDGETDAPDAFDVSDQDPQGRSPDEPATTARRDSAWGGTAWAKEQRRGLDADGPNTDGPNADGPNADGRTGHVTKGRPPIADGRTIADHRTNAMKDDSDTGKGDPSFSNARGPRVARSGRDRDPAHGTARGAGGGQAAPETKRGGPERPTYRDDAIMILDEDVRPAVLFNLEERLGIEVWDRTRLILEIFSQHAHVKEARLQVELAKLQYEIPLIHEAVHRRRSGERPGFRGGGEYGVADYEAFIKRRMRTVKDELERIRNEREVRRKVRREQFYLVSLAGYTNAGKSSLLNALTDAGTLSENKMFSTLETTTRRMAPPREMTTGTFDKTTGDQGAVDKEASDPGTADHDAKPEGLGASSNYVRPVLLTDTVGFIQALPSWLLDAFHSTLEEIALSDVVLLVADAADPIEVLLEKVRVCQKELQFLDVTCPIVLVLNKADLVPDRAIEVKGQRVAQESVLPVRLAVASSLTGDGIQEVIRSVHDALPDLIGYEAEIPQGDHAQRFTSQLYDWGPVTRVDYSTNTTVEGACDPLYWKTLLKQGLRADARVTRVTYRPS